MSSQLRRYHKNRPAEARICACGCEEYFIVGYGFRKRHTQYIDRSHKERAHLRRNRKPTLNRGIKRNRLIVQEEAKLRGGTCEDCGRSDTTLYWHHNDPATKRFEIGKGVGHAKGVSSLIQELKVCRLLCQSCHLRRHVVLHEKAPGLQLQLFSSA